MKFTQLKEIFPEAKLLDNPSERDDDLSYFSEGKWITLPKASLSSREIKLLNSLYHQINQTSQWFDFLILGNNTLNESSQTYSIIQFNVDAINDTQLWLDVLSEYFGSIEDAFFVTPTYGLLVYKGTLTLDLDQFEAMMGPLDEDFETKASFYIGFSHQLDQHFVELFKAEQALFLKYQAHSPISNFLKIYLPALIKPVLDDYPVSKELKQIITTQDMSLLIKTLWDHKGNISSSAQSLFLHRNTLLYRIDRFYEITGINLKNLDDLLLCYLLIM
ncbi:hypothetical protein AOC36_00770 [Erysipelothrix larvae]|uniref:PucR C-terminal helix-turn-helix domain-containing protein n=1 Tax=Erysipelothrix larvae TaxID=1514105 RepID=A0A0X8GY46_9FIRM|nr:helix-turn-helix domain-containing protein [Erysipelothrix larvae]AMC92576.1 hypothetical protein AOC36_00770 [Erysipelothrix larvae]